jgi:hypothetical protein
MTFYTKTNKIKIGQPSLLCIIFTFYSIISILFALKSSHFHAIMLLGAFKKTFMQNV